METESPVSNVGRVKFGWRLGTEVEAGSTTAVNDSTVVATSVGGAAVAVSTVAVKWAEADNGEGVMGSSPITI